MRDQALNVTLLRFLAHARMMLAASRSDYNEHRPQSRLGWPTPSAYDRAPPKNAAGTLRHERAQRFGLLPRPQARDQITRRLHLRLMR